MRRSKRIATQQFRKDSLLRFNDQYHFNIKPVSLLTIRLCDIQQHVEYDVWKMLHIFFDPSRDLLLAQVQWAPYWIEKKFFRGNCRVLRNFQEFKDHPLLQPSLVGDDWIQEPLLKGGDDFTDHELKSFDDNQIHQIMKNRVASIKDAFAYEWFLEAGSVNCPSPGYTEEKGKIGLMAVIAERTVLKIPGDLTSLSTLLLVVQTPVYIPLIDINSTYVITNYIKHVLIELEKKS